MLKNILLAGMLAFCANAVANEDEHFEAALATVTILESEQLDSMIKALVDNQVESNPSFRPIRKAFETFYQETFSSEEFRHGLANIQMEIFTYEELLQLKQLMGMPIFKKYEKIMPEIMAKHLQFGQQLVMENQDRLVELIEQEHNRIEKLQELDDIMNLTEKE